MFPKEPDIRCVRCQRELRLGEGRYMIMQNDRLVEFCMECFHSQPFPFWAGRLPVDRNSKS